jgi:hypothetical protein
MFADLSATAAISAPGFGGVAQFTENAGGNNGPASACNDTGSNTTMLRITIQDSPEVLTFLVEGKLVGQWAKELEQAWKKASSLREHRQAIVDLTEMLFVDEEGRRVLSKLFREGAFFRTACPMTESIVSEITGKSKRALRGALLPAVLGIAVAMHAHAAQPPTQPTTLRLTLHDAVEMALK